jgi:hypothetical protein
LLKLLTTVLNIFDLQIQARGRARREGGSLFFFQEYFEADQVRPVCPLQHYKKCLYAFFKNNNKQTYSIRKIKILYVI